MLKNTFLDVVDGEEEPVGRRQTMPEGYGDLPTAEEGTSHVAALNSIWSGLTPPAFRESCVSNDLLGSHAPQTEVVNEALSGCIDHSQLPRPRAMNPPAHPAALPASGAPIQKCEDASLHDDVQRVNSLQRFAVVSTETMPPCISGEPPRSSAHSGGSDLEEAAPKQSTLVLCQPLADEPTADELPSVGSQWHNMGSCRPCVYVRSTKGCKFGLSCDFCHIAAEHGESVRSRPSKGKRVRMKKAMASLEWEVARNPEVTAGGLVLPAILDVNPRARARIMAQLEQMATCMRSGARSLS